MAAWFRNFPRPLAILLAVTLATCAFGWLFKAHCTFNDGGWTNSEQYTSGCYSDAMPFWGGREIAAGKLPYFESRMEYPVLTGALIYVGGRVTALAFGQDATPPDFLLIVTLLNTLLALGVTALLWSMRIGSARLWCWAFAPPLVLYVGHNWDLLAIVLAVAALALAQRGQLARAAALAGLGAAAKLFPVFLLPLLALRALFARRVRAVVTMALAAIAAWGAVNLPVAALAFDNWREFYVFSGDRAGTAGSIWEIVAQAGWLAASIAERNLWSGLAFAGGAGLIVALGWRRHRDHLWVLFTPTLLWFLLVNKVYSPQFDLWVYPLMLITARHIAPIAVFVAGDILAYFAEFWWFAGLEGASPSADPHSIMIAAAIRGAAMLWLIASAVAEPAPNWMDRPPDPSAVRNELR